MSLVTPVAGPFARPPEQSFVRPRRDAGRPRPGLAAPRVPPKTGAAGGAKKRFRATLLGLGAVCALAALAVSARAGQSRTLIIPADDGYGFQECFASHSACGEMAASAWCEANGLKKVQDFGRAEDLPAAAGAVGSFYVSCSDAS